MYKNTFFSSSFLSYETLLFILYSLDVISFKVRQSMCFRHICTVLKYGLVWIFKHNQSSSMFTVACTPKLFASLQNYSMHVLEFHFGMKS